METYYVGPVLKVETERCRGLGPGLGRPRQVLALHDRGGGGGVQMKNLPAQPGPAGVLSPNDKRAGAFI